MGRCTLKAYKVNPEVFDNIIELASQDNNLRVTNNITTYYKGYTPRDIITYDGHERLICRDIYLHEFCPEISETLWKQLIIRKDEGQSIPCMEDITGDRAWAYVWKGLKHYYSEDELIQILHEHEADYNEELIQLHYYYPQPMSTAKEFINCYKFDINGAHTDALVELFPKAKPFLLKLYNERKIHPVNKMYCNYFVGSLKPKGYEKTYNWIVQRTTKILMSAIDYCGGTLIYANTDGFAVQNPDHILETSTELGAFKKEYEGTIYTYKDKNYWVMQAGSTVVGSIMYKVRKYLDLSQHKVVHYSRVLEEGIFKCINIEEEIIKNEESKWEILE